VPSVSTRTSPEVYRQHFRLLREALKAWMSGDITPSGTPSYRDFVGGIVAVLEHVRQHHTCDVWVVSSGGPIANAVGHVLQASANATIDMNLHIRNTAISELRFNPKRLSLHTFNTLPHLEGPELSDWVTYA
jgi:broad specificity phosphatase PhoE